MKKNKNKYKTTNKMDIVETRVRRFMAMIIDWYLTNMLAAIPITFYLRGADYLKPEMFDLTHYSFSIGVALGLYGILLGFIYYILIPTYVFKGQTLGKKMCKIKVFKDNYEEINLKDMLIRELIGASLLEGGMIIIPTYIRKMLPLFHLSILVNPLKYLAYGLTLFSIIYAYFQTDSKAFHDKIAHTIVIKQ